mgnify:CR=1 FL=1
MQYAEKYSIDLLEKGADKKKGQTKKERKSGRSRARPGPCFGQLNDRYQSQNLSKVAPKTSSGFLLRSQLRPRVSDFVSAVTARLNFSPDPLKSLSALGPGTGRGEGGGSEGKEREAKGEREDGERAPKKISKFERTIPVNAFADL